MRQIEAVEDGIAGAEEYPGRAPLTILHVAAPAAVGGLERVLVALATGHCQRGHRVHVAAVLSEDDAGHSFISSLRAARVDVHSVVVPARAYARERKLMAALFRQIRPDIVHTHGYRPDVIDASLARRLRIPTVTTVHGFTRRRGRGRVYEWLQRRSFRRFDAVVAVSRPQLEELRQAGVPLSRLHLVPNAWNGAVPSLEARAARTQLGVGTREFHVGWVGRLSREKGADVLVSALSALIELPLVVSVIGDGHQVDALRRQANGTGVDIRWHGVLPNAAPLFAAFDVFVLSSRTEGTPIALFEAMAAGVPVVATAVGGVPDVVSEAEAWLVPPNDPVALATAIRRVFNGRADAAARAERARSRLMTQFAPAPWLTRYEALYRKLKEGRIAG